MRRKYGTKVLMQEDGAKYHFAPAAATCKDQKKVKRLRWPAQSPDLSPIENLWKQVKDAVSSRYHWIRSIDEIAIIIKEE